MNHLTVIAHGDPNSFARRVQVDPTIAVELVQKVRAWVEACDSNSDPAGYAAFIVATEELHRHFKTMQNIHGI